MKVNLLKQVSPCSPFDLGFCEVLSGSSRLPKQLFNWLKVTISEFVSLGIILSTSLEVGGGGSCCFSSPR